MSRGFDRWPAVGAPSVDRIPPPGDSVTSVSNSDGTLTISPTTGSVVASLNLAHANVWTGGQTFSVTAPIVSTLTAGRVLIAGASKEIADDSGLTYDATNDRLMVGTAISTSGVDLNILKTVAGQVSIGIGNSSSNAAAFCGVYVANDSASTYLGLECPSSAYNNPAHKANNGCVVAVNELHLVAGNLGAAKDIAFYVSTTEYARLLGAAGSGSLAGNFGHGVTNPTAVLHLKAGSTTAGSAPLKFNTGSLLTTAEAGAVEFLTDKGYLTITTSAARKELALWDAAGTSGRVPYVTTNGRLTDASGFTFDGSTLTVAGLKDSALTSGRVTYATASGALTDSSVLTFDGTSLCLGTATVDSTAQITCKRTTNGINGIVNINGSNGNAARSFLFLQNDAGVNASFAKYSTGFTTGGLLAASVAVLSNDSGALIIANTAAQPIVLAVAGTAAANEAFRILGAAGSGSVAGNIGIGAAGGVTNPTAYLHIKAGTATAGTAPLKLTSGTSNTTAEAGAMEYNGTNLFFTRSGTTREGVITESAVNSVSPTSPNRTVTVNIDGTTYYLHAKTTND